MRHQHQRSIGGLDETTRSVRHLVPAAALLVVREFLNHPAARENAGFSPSAQEVEHAERVVTLNKQAAAEGRASFAIDGKMIDIPIVQRAEALLERASAIASRSHRAS
ncbi:MAG: citrate lyase subunit beta / citryl-CoA lyase [Bradyrhizobium sp.]|jgi:predicted RNA binding protein with dsRBD fold (UPF0201 family)